ncbi:hypothetical protein K431DRAFT_236252 [Polychaeton citri CBS 116435]|uniref:Uncharacterized protein n=1 Tax=Polychaeton citri CBS 116435 TaxID=1314669 RepID=A0A9P4PYA2_9PEZI|nr:hypothetical protein K431DRAFT_236252 [Polychaeton citri CBS 116435]
MNSIEVFALLGSPARVFSRLLLFGRYLYFSPACGPSWPRDGFARARWGPRHKLKPWLLFDVQELERLEELLNYGTDSDVMEIRDSYVESFKMVSVGALLAQIPVSAFALPALDQTHYFARGCFVLAMITSLFAVFFTCLQQRTLGFLFRPIQVRAWLSNGRRYTNHKGDCVFQSSYSSHQFLQAPYELLGMSITLFILAFSIYLGSALTRHIKLNVKPNGEETGNLGVLIAFLVCGAFALCMFGQLLGAKDLENDTCLEEMQLHAFKPKTPDEKSPQSDVTRARRPSAGSESSNSAV